MNEMTTLEIAKAFGTNVKGLCKITGYSRQALKGICKGEFDGKADRWAAAVMALRDYAEIIYMKDRYEAERRFNKRMALCDRLTNKDFERENKGAD